MHNVSQTYMDILAGRYVVDMALMVADDRPAQICTDAQLMARNDPAHPENGPVYREDYISEMKTKASTFSGANPEIGAVTARQLNLELRNPVQSIPRAARLVPYARIRNEEQASEWIPKGEFRIDTRDTEPGYQDAGGNDVQFLEIYGVDALMKAEADYPESSLQWPAWDSDVLDEIARFLGVSIEPETESVINNRFQVPTCEDYCPREILSQIAVAYAGNFGLDDFGRLQFRKANAAAGRSGVNIQNNMDDFKFGEPLPLVTRVELTNAGDNTTYAAGSNTTGRTITAETPWASDELAAAVLAEVQGMSYQPMTAQGAVIDPAVELGDVLTVGGVTSRMYSQDLTFGEAASSDIRAPSDNDTDHEYTFKRKRDRQTARTAKALAGLGRKTNKLEGDLEHDSVELKARVTNAEAGMEAVTERKLKRDAQGNIIYLRDKDGNLILDDNGQPVPDYEYAQSSAKVAAALTEYDSKGNKHGIEALLDLLAVKNEDGTYTSLASISATASNALAKFDLKAYYDQTSGRYKSIADLMADVITLNGDVKILGNFSVDGSGTMQIKAPVTSFYGGNVYLVNGSKLFLTGNPPLQVNGIDYEGKEVTWLLNPRTKQPIGSVLKKQ